MRRRDVLAGLAVAAAWPLGARAQVGGMPTIGFLAVYGPDTGPDRRSAFHEGLAEAGYVEGVTVAVEYRWAEGRYDRIDAFAADLVKRGVAVIFATGGNEPALAARAATGTIPIVFVMGNDPVELGLAASVSHPGGNLTGVTTFGAIPEPKRLALLGELLPEGAVVGALLNPSQATFAAKSVVLDAAARSLGLRLLIVTASSEAELEPAFARMGAEGVAGLFVDTSSALAVWRTAIVELASRYQLPAVYPGLSYVEAGGLMGYGVDLPAAYREAGRYVGRILNGEDPASLPILNAATFSLALNMRTAQVLGIEFPVGLLAGATHIVE